MKEHFSLWRDRQEEPPVAYCGACGGEIYDEDRVCLDGGLLHAACVAEDERDLLCAMPARELLRGWRPC